MRGENHPHGPLAWLWLRRHAGHDIAHMSDWRSCGWLCRTCRKVSP